MASGTKGYSSYRGRGSKGKILLAAVLILIILASVGFILTREHLTYDGEGNLRFVLPWADKDEKTESVPKEPMGDVIIETVEPTPEPASRQGVLLPVGAVTEEAVTAAREAYGETLPLAVTLKDATGAVYFESAVALPGTLRFDREKNGVALAALTVEGASGAIARVSCFHDPKAANHDVESRGLKNTGGYIFYDGGNSQWLDPGKKDARTYLTEIIREASELGFDEILLTDVSYPTVGKLDKIAYTYQDANATASEGRRENLALFLKEVRAALPENVVLSLELDADTIRAGEHDAAGQDLDELAALVDRIYAPTTAAEAPALAETVRAAGCAFVPELAEIPAGEVENWLVVEENA